jgi:hypothetical protein
VSFSPELVFRWTSASRRANRLPRWDWAWQTGRHEGIGRARCGSSRGLRTPQRPVQRALPYVGIVVRPACPVAFAQGLHDVSAGNQTRWSAISVLNFGPSRAPVQFHGFVPIGSGGDGSTAGTGRPRRTKSASLHKSRATPEAEAAPGPFPFRTPQFLRVKLTHLDYIGLYDFFDLVKSKNSLGCRYPIA